MLHKPVCFHSYVSHEASLATFPTIARDGEGVTASLIHLKTKIHFHKNIDEKSGNTSNIHTRRFKNFLHDRHSSSGTAAFFGLVLLGRAAFRRRGKEQQLQLIENKPLIGCFNSEIIFNKDSFVRKRQPVTMVTNQATVG